eukprot:jgi/Mesvir1/3612/Mv13026-RA.1
MLATGSSDGTLRLWDIRRSGAFLVLDQHNKQPVQGQGKSLQGRASVHEGLPVVGSRRLGRLLRGGSGGCCVDPLPLASAPSGRGSLSSSTLARGNTRKRGPPEAASLYEGQHASPGLAAHPQAQAHDGAITSVQWLPDGMRLLSLGDDRQLRLWDVPSSRNLLVNFARGGGSAPRAPMSKGMQMAVSPDGELVWAPNRHDVEEFAVLTGQRIGPPLRAHYDFVHACAFCPSLNVSVACRGKRRSCAPVVHCMCCAGMWTHAHNQRSFQPEPFMCSDLSQLPVSGSPLDASVCGEGFRLFTNTQG